MKSSLLAVLLVSLAAGPTFAYSVGVSNGVPVRWKASTVPFKVQAIGSDDLTPVKTDIAINAAIATWNSLGCSNLVIERTGDAPNPKTNLLAGAAPNGINDIHWLEDATWSYGKWVLGVTAPVTAGGAFIAEADIAFNGYKQKWSINGDGRIDVESVALHEIGHAFGLNHNLGPYDESDLPTMHPSVLPNLASRSLSPDDVNATCFLYPATPYVCGGDGDCPMILGHTASGDEYYAGRLGCDAGTGTCSDTEYFPAGIAQIGEICEYDSSCVEGLRCQPWQNTAVCSTFCLVEDPGCPADFTCTPFSSVPQYGACLPTDGIPKEPGQGPGGCVSTAVCLGGKLCLPTPTGEKKVCTELCDATVDGACGAGRGCWSYGAKNGGCFELALFPPPVPDPGPEPVADIAPELAPEPVPDSAPDAGPVPDTSVSEVAPDGSGPAPDQSAPETTGPGDASVAELSTPDSAQPGGGSASSGCGATPEGAGWSWALGLLLGFALLKRRRRAPMVAWG
ncbi:MAG: matrixin family metalloprotease [Myxococcota bacterium]